LHAGLTAGYALQKRPHAAIDHVVHPWPAFLQARRRSHNPRRGNRPDVAGADQPDRPLSPISQHAASGRNLPRDPRRWQRFRRDWPSGWRSRGLGLGEAAAATARTNTFLDERYRRIVKRRGRLKTLVAVARSSLVIIWHLPVDPAARFRDLKSDYHMHPHRTQAAQPHRPTHRHGLPGHLRTRRLSLQTHTSATSPGSASSAGCFACRLTNSFFRSDRGNLLDRRRRAPRLSVSDPNPRGCDEQLHPAETTQRSTTVWHERRRPHADSTGSRCNRFVGYLENRAITHSE
jgi:hypothetical protein